MVIFLTACVDDSPSRNVSSEEKASTYLDMGVRYLEMGQLKFAKENLEKALDLNSSNADIHDATAVLYERLKEPEQARKHYEISLQISADNPQSQNNYGRFLCEQGNYTEGLLHLNLALKMPLNNRRWFALTNTGRCLLQQGDKTQAEAYFREALLLQNDYPPALLEMLKISYHEAKYLSAEAFLQRYQNVAELTAETLWYAVQIEFALEHKALAETYRSRLWSEFPVSEEAKRLRTATGN
jgi:type IV pilus assembly protein PilF